MIWLCFIWFTMLYGAAIFFTPEKSIFSPIRFVSAKFAFFNLPFILFTALFPDSFLKGILSICHTDVYSAFLKYTLVQTLAYFSLIAGILVVRGRKKQYEELNITYNYKALVIYAITIGFLVLGAYLYFLYSIGGFFYLVTHLKDRVLLQQGRYYLMLLDLMPISLLILLLIIKKTNKPAFKILFWVLAFLSVFMLTSFGARKPSLVLVGVLVVGWYFYIAPIVFNRKTLLRAVVVLCVFVVYILSILHLRRTENPNRFKDKSEAYVLVYDFVYQLSYTYIDVFVANYFNADNAWYLDGYFAPVRAFGHKGDKGDIPHVDQGVYLKTTFFRQKDYRPPMPRKDLESTSWPTENFGFAFANFTWWGIVIFFFLQGAVFEIVFRVVSKHMYNPVLLFVYVNVILQFNFSSLRIAFFVKTLLLFSVCWFVFNKFAVNKNQPSIF